MDEYVLAWRWLAHAAVGGSIVSGPGKSRGLALCRQPVRRARVVVLTLLGRGRRPLARLPAHRAEVVRGLRSDACRSGGLVRACLARAEIAARFDRLPLARLRVELPQRASRSRRGPCGAALARRERIPIEACRSRATSRILVRRGWRALSWAAVALALLTSPRRPGWRPGGCSVRSCSGASLARRGQSPPEIHEVFREISGPAGRAVLLLESDRVDLAVHLHLDYAR